MNRQRKILLLFILLIMFIALPCSAPGAINPLIVKTSVTLSGEKIQFAYEIKNAGMEAARHLTVTTFLAGKTDRSESLGEVARDALAHYRCAFDIAGMPPGIYTPAVRVDFGDSGGPHRIYHFSSVTLKAESAKKDADPLNIKLKSPAFNRKSFWQPRGKLELTLKNSSPQPAKPVLIFFLPDGFNVAEPEKVYTLKAGEELMLKIPVSFNHVKAVESDYWALAWHETGGIHYSQLITGVIRVGESPVYFKLFLVVSAVVVLAAAIIYALRRRRNAG